LAGSDENLAGIGAALNGVRAGQFERLDRVGGRFSISLSSSDTWQAHLIAIREFVHSMSEPISASVGLGISVEIDVALEPEDLVAKDFVSFALPSMVLKELGTRGVALVFTSYGQYT